MGHIYAERFEYKWHFIKQFKALANPHCNSNDIVFIRLDAFRRFIGNFLPCLYIFSKMIKILEAAILTSVK